MRMYVYKLIKAGIECLHSRQLPGVADSVGSHAAQLTQTQAGAVCGSP